VPQEDPSPSRWPTPRWFPLVAGPLLGALVLVNLGLIYIWLENRGRTGSSMPLLIVINCAVALFLLYRIWKAVVPHTSSSRCSDFSASGGASYNRWRDP
jgi:hypothetical protein